MGSSLLHKSLYLGAVTPFTRDDSSLPLAVLIPTLPWRRGVEGESGGGLSSSPTCAGDAGCGRLPSRAGSLETQGLAFPLTRSQPCNPLLRLQAWGLQ